MRTIGLRYLFLVASVACTAGPLAPVDQRVSGGNAATPNDDDLNVTCVATSADPTASMTGTEEEPAVSVNATGRVSVSCDGGKVLICHRPPGNPANEHTLCIGAPAVDAHMTHHPDSLGACAASADAGGGAPVLDCANEACASSTSCP